MSPLVRHRCWLLGALLAGAGCATASSVGQGFDGRVKQADEKLPAAARFYDEGDRKLVEEAQERQAAGRKALDSGNPEKARTEFAAAAERYARFADARPTSEWRIAFRYKAAEFSLFAQQGETAARLADQVLAEPAASPVTRAMAAQLSATAWRGVVSQKIKAGEIEAPRLLAVESRGGAPLAPRAPPEPWGRFLAAVDAWVEVWDRHADAPARQGDRGGALTPWQGERMAAEVEFSCDRMKEAQRRLARIVRTWPGEADAMEAAVPLLLQTFLVLGDEAGYAGARDEVRSVLEAQAAKAGDAKVQATYERIRGDVVARDEWVDFARAKRLLDEGKSQPAAEAFERFAAAWPSSGDAATALYNAATAWDRLEKADKAVAAREAIVAKYASSKVAPVTALHLASAASRRGDHEAAARHYGTHLERWPDAANRCLAMQNLGVELDLAGKKVDAAERYLAFGIDGRCAKERPNDAAKALYRGGKLFIEAKLKPRAKEAFQGATRVEGVTDAAALRLVEDAKRQDKRL